MRSRYRIQVGGTHLDSLDSNLLILDIKYPQPEQIMARQSTANLDGYDISNTMMVQRTVVVTFELRIYDIAKRNAALQKVYAWAKKGGSLRTNDREDQYLAEVVCQQYPEMNSRDWTEPLSVTFATTVNPYWQSSTAKTLSLTGKSPSGKLKVDGNTGKAMVSVTATAAASVTSFQAKVATDTIKLTGLSVSSGQKIIIDYISGRFLRVRSNGKSVMAKMTTSSSDALRADCGENNAVSFTANGKMTAVFSARGLWL